MIVTCNPETYPGAPATCGATFNDEQRSTTCPHPRLDDLDGPGLPPVEAAPGLFADAAEIPCPVVGCNPPRSPDMPDGPILYHRGALARHLALFHDTTIAAIEAEQLAALRPPPEPGPDLDPPPPPEGNAGRARYLLEHVQWAIERGVEVDANGLAARAQVYATLAVAEAFGHDHGTQQLAESPCGAEMILEWWEGTPRALRWCARQAGPCPFAGATSFFHYRTEVGAPLPVGSRECAVLVEEAASSTPGTVELGGESDG